MNVAVRKDNVNKMASRRSTFTPKSINKEEMSVETVVVTETTIMRNGWVEILTISEKAIVPTRLGQLPLLNGHRDASLETVIGRVEDWHIRGKKVFAKLYFADTELGRHAFTLVEQGMVRAVSVGYYRFEDECEVSVVDGVKVVRFTRWMPMEVSLVSVPADPNTLIRGVQSMDEDDVDIIDDPVSKRNAPLPKILRQIEDIRRRGIDAGITETELDDAFLEVRTAEQASNTVLDLLAKRSVRQITSPFSSTRSADAGDISEQVIEAFSVRLGATSNNQAANPLIGRSLVEIGRSYLDGVGVATRGLSDDRISDLMAGTFRHPLEFATRSSIGHVAADFPFLLEEGGNRALMERFQATASPWKRHSTLRNARDFRPQSFIRPGEAPKLEKVAENGEIKSGTLEEEKNGWSVETYARMFTLSRKAIINDDLGAFTDFLWAFSDSAIETEGDLFFALLSANGFGGTKLSDNKNLFHADHGNLAVAGSALSVASLSDAREAMRLQKNVNGTGRAGAVPATIIVGPKLETTAEQLIASIAATNVGDVNPFSGKLKVEVENRYEGTGWWLLADPASRPVLAHGYLEGSEGPRVESRDGWGILGREFRCILDFGCGVFDHRAIYFNPGP